MCVRADVASFLRSFFRSPLYTVFIFFSLRFQEYIEVSGACAAASIDGVYAKVGTTAGGAPFYTSARTSKHLYYDSNCDGKASSGRWIFDDDAPDMQAQFDLDQDESCDYLAASVSVAMDVIVSSDEWDMLCNRNWRVKLLTIVHQQAQKLRPCFCAFSVFFRLCA